MSKQETLKKLEEIFRDLLDDEEFILTEDMKKEDVDDWDSMFHITLIATIADEFCVEFTTDEMLAATNVSSILEILNKGV